MQFWQTVLNIVVFIVCLSLVVCIHEAGHLAVAKICKVYCFEYSIGFGPAIFTHRFKHKKKKPKNEKALTKNLYEAKEAKEAEFEYGETQFSIRALPLGGYVAMAGEDGNMTEDGQVIPPERCLNGVNHFKQICIMLAGITMNFILALVLFFGSNIAPHEMNILDSNAIVLADGESPAKKAGLQNGDKIITMYQQYDNLVLPGDNNHTFSIQFPAEADRVTLKYYQQAKDVEHFVTYDDLDPSSISYASQDIFSNYRYNKTSDGKPAFDLEAYGAKYNIPDLKNYVPNGGSTRTFYISYERMVDGEKKVFDTVTETIKTKEVKESSNVSHYTFNLLGITCQTKTVYLDFGTAVVKSFDQFGNLFVNLYTALGSIFTPSGWQNVGGIISVYKMSAQGTQSGSFSYIMLLWGYISLNLGCFNLLPFPGLDGWQTLLALFETITRKKVPSKVKNVANSVGLIIMFVLAGLLIIKDFIMF